MSNNYYAGNVIYNNQHKELTNPGQSVCTADDEDCKGFFC